MLTPKLEAAQDNIRARWDPNFRWVLNDSVPWTPFSMPLSAATVALISTCGLYRLDTQQPFDAWNDLGDASFREIHEDTPADRLRVAHSHYDHTQVAGDANVALPVRQFRSLVERGVVGKLHPWTYSFMGYVPEPRQLIHEMAPAVGRRLVAEGVHAAFLTPC